MDGKGYVSSLSSVDDDATTRLIRVAIIDDHWMVADSLSRVLSEEPDFEVVGTAKSIEEAITLVGKHLPDVILMDYRLPDGDGASATAAILERWPDVRIVMLSGVADGVVLARSIEAGCVGLISKDRSIPEVVDAIRSAARGESVVRADELSSLFHQLRRPTPSSTVLSEREMTVLQLLAKVMSVEEIAEQLFISPNTVRNHISAILTKTGTHSRLEAVALAIRHGVIKPADVG
jgi:DNA-binding NarL/FixJ family response regulator